METIRNKILKRIKNYRDLNNLSQDEISKKMNITQSAYARFESGKSKTDLELLELFCNTLKIDFEDFLYQKKQTDEASKIKPEKITVTFEVSPDKRDILLNLVTEENINK